MKKLTKREIMILGTGGTSRDILDIIYDINKFYNKEIYQVSGFLEDDQPKWGKEINGIRVQGPLISANKYKNTFFVNGIGSPTSFLDKEKIITKSGICLDRFITLIHPSANISKSAQIGSGSVIFPNVVVGHNVKIGKHVVILPNTVISHDGFIGDYVCIAGCVYISGAVSVGSSCYIGANASIKESLSIGEGSLIGIGSVVLENIEKGRIMIGNPARLLRHSKER